MSLILSTERCAACRCIRQYLELLELLLGRQPPATYASPTSAAIDTVVLLTSSGPYASPTSVAIDTVMLLMSSGTYASPTSVAIDIVLLLTSNEGWLPTATYSTFLLILQFVGDCCTLSRRPLVLHLASRRDILLAAGTLVLRAPLHRTTCAVGRFCVLR